MSVGIIINMDVPGGSEKRKNNMQKVFVFDTWLDSVDDKLNGLIQYGYHIDQFQVVVSSNNRNEGVTSCALIVVVSEKPDHGRLKEDAIYTYKEMFSET